MIEISNTGERILLEKETPLMISRHFCAYKFAQSFVAGKEVLDIGCGEGYGSAFLAGGAKRVMGIDYNHDVIDYAKNKYRKDNLEFMVLDVANLSSLGHKFDIICSFQNIEHIQDTRSLLNNISALLKKGGVFICSTCNKKDASPGRDIPLNKFHVREYSADEFRDLLLTHFKEVDILGLQRSFTQKFFRRLKKLGIFRFLPENIDPVKRFYAHAHCGYFIFKKNNLENCLDFIAVCNN